MIVKSTLALLVATSSVVVPTTIAPTLSDKEIILETAKEYARNYSESCVAFVPSIVEYQWDYETAIDVMWNESHCNPVAYNPNDLHNGCTGSVGLFQTACIHGDRDELEEPSTNIAMAHKLYTERGWKPWGVCFDGKVECGL